MTKSSQKFATAVKMAESHLEIDPTVQKVFLLERAEDADDAGPIRLLEVVEGTIERGIEPVFFTPDPQHGIRFPSIIVEVSPREFDKLGHHIQFRSETWHLGEELASRS